MVLSWSDIYEKGGYPVSPGMCQNIKVFIV